MITTSYAGPLLIASAAGAAHLLAREVEWHFASVTILRGHVRRFAVGAVVAGFAATAALDVLSPDALIARTDLTRPHVDVGYLAGLSDGDWRSWNLARPRARAALRR